MAMATWLQATSDAEIETLVREPHRVNALDRPVCFRTHFATALNWFLTGDAYPGPDDHPVLYAMFEGAQNVDCDTLENGNFGVVRAADVAGIARALAAVDTKDLRTRIAAADFDELVDEEEVYDLEIIEVDEAPRLLLAELQGLVAFYEAAAEAKLGVVTFTV